MNIDALWEYSNPEKSEKKFREALTHSSKDEQLELLTQIARTYSLRREFEEAHKILNEVETKLNITAAKPNIRFQLEKGRSYNSEGHKDKARTHFERAVKEANKANETGLAVDALHMLAITYAGQAEAIQWNQKALTLAQSSQEKKARAMIPAILNNTAWDLFDLKRFNEALNFFKDAEHAWASTGKARQTKIAKWSVAKCLRALGRHDEALKILHELEKDYDAVNESNGFVYEEIAENMFAKDNKDKAKPYFKKAYVLLEKDDWLSSHEAERLKRLKALSD